MKYRVGDKVRVRSDLVVGRTYYMEDRTVGDCFVPAMSRLCGQVVTIEGDYCGTYSIKEFEYNWTDEMFENSRLGDFIRCLMSEIK